MHLNAPMHLIVLCASSNACTQTQTQRGRMDALERRMARIEVAHAGKLALVLEQVRSPRISRHSTTFVPLLTTVRARLRA